MLGTPRAGSTGLLCGEEAFLTCTRVYLCVPMCHMSCVHVVWVHVCVLPDERQSP